VSPIPASRERFFRRDRPGPAKFSGTATLSDIDAPNTYTLTGSGSGGAAGMVKGGATVRLVTDGGETVPAL